MTEKPIKITVMRMCSCKKYTPHWHVGHDIDRCCEFPVPPFRLSLWRQEDDGVWRGESMFAGFRGARALRKKHFQEFENVVKELWTNLPKGRFVDITDKVGGILEGYLEDLAKIDNIPRKRKIEL